jgi:hypothetical protein
MTPGQLIDMLADAGMLKEESPGVFGWHPTMEKAERFRASVAAAERERLAAKFMEMHNAQQHRNNYFAFAARVIREEA